MKHESQAVPISELLPSLAVRVRNAETFGENAFADVRGRLNPKANRLVDVHQLWSSTTDGTAVIWAALVLDVIINRAIVARPVVATAAGRI